MLSRGIKGLPTLCLRACVVTDNRGQKSARLVDHNWIKTTAGIKQHYILPNQSFAISHHVSKAKYGVNYTIYCAIEIRKYSQMLVVSCENTGDLWDIPWYTPRKRCITSIYYSFQIFPRFWLVKSTRIIHHNQLLLTKYWTNDVKSAARRILLNQWRQNDVRSAARCRLLHRWPRKPGDKVVLRLVSGKTNSEMAKLL